jgi:branched-chain amino acid transport system substrate-binding protein
MRYHVTRRGVLSGFGAALVVAGGLAAAAAPASAQSGEPIKLGFSMALTGPLAPNGKQALLGAKIWEEEINAKGGLLGRKVELVHYDDQSNPTNVPGIYTKLLESTKSTLSWGRTAPI